jgi:hypothetical protein
MLGSCFVLSEKGVLLDGILVDGLSLLRCTLHEVRDVAILDSSFAGFHGVHCFSQCFTTDDILDPIEDSSQMEHLELSIMHTKDKLYSAAELLLHIATDFLGALDSFPGNFLLKKLCVTQIISSIAIFDPI